MTVVAQSMTQDGQRYICDGCGEPVRETVNVAQPFWYDGVFYSNRSMPRPARSHAVCVLGALESAGWQVGAPPVGYDWRRDNPNIRCEV